MSLTVVVGPPASGKSTWVAERAEPGDIVIDLDALALALTAPGVDPHDYPPGVKHVAMKARRAAIRAALERATDTRVYIIHWNPPPSALSLYHEHGAEIVTVDPGRSIVMDRCRAQRPPRALTAAEQWYATESERDFRPTHYSRSW